MISPERVASLCRRLRGAGLRSALTESTTALEISAHLDSEEAEEVRLGFRAAFCSARGELEVFDQCFWPWWHGEESEDSPSTVSTESPGRRSPSSLPLGAGEQLELAEGNPGPENLAEKPTAIGSAYSPADDLARRPFESVSADELRAIDAWIDQLMVTLATRRSRRLEPGGRRGIVDVRRTLRSAIGHDGELIQLIRKRRRLDRPRLVVLCDVSGSMERYSRFLLRFLLGCGRVQDIETFAFSTRLTHLTPWLATSAIDPALAQLRARGWSSGTRIGDCLETFLRGYGGRMLGQRTLVLILSDGLDQGEVEPLERAMHRIQRRSRKVLWLNPLLESSRYAPEARGMRAALPFVDYFHSGHSLEALRDLPRLLRL